MLKQSLTISIFFLFFIGLSDYGYGHHDPDHIKGGGGGGGGDGNQTEPSVIIFRDLATHQIRSDTLKFNTYTDERINTSGEPGVLVSIGSKANLGNIFLKGEGGITAPLPDSTGRLLFLDFVGCMGDCPFPFPFPTGLVQAGLLVEVNAKLKNGVYDITDFPQKVPMRIQFKRPGDDVPFEENWFLDFNPDKRKCDDSEMVTVTKTGVDEWTVTGDGIRGCLTPAGRPNPKPVGIFEFSFEFRVMID